MTHDDERLQAWEREAIAWFLHGKGAAKGDGKGDVSGAGKGSGLGPPMKGDGKGKKGPPEASSLSRPLASVPRTSMPPPEPSAPPRKAAAPKAARSKESTPAGGIRPKARPDGG